MANKQTAVDWLFEQLVSKTDRMYFLEELQKAKQMEKEQIIEAYNQGFREGEEDGKCGNSNTGDVSEYINAEQYYNETFGKDENT